MLAKAEASEVLIFLLMVSSGTTRQDSSVDEYRGKRRTDDIPQYIHAGHDTDKEHEVPECYTSSNKPEQNEQTSHPKYQCPGPTYTIR